MSARSKKRTLSAIRDGTYVGHWKVGHIYGGIAKVHTALANVPYQIDGEEVLRELMQLHGASQNNETGPEILAVMHIVP